MSEQKIFPTVVNFLSDTPSPHTAAPQSWKHFNVTYLRTKTSDWPEHYHRAVQITIPVRTEYIYAHYQSATGRRRSTRLISGDVCIIPSQQPHTMLWREDSEFVFFNLEPQFIFDAAHDAARGGLFEIEERYGIRDPLIEQIGIAVCAEFFQPTGMGRIYVESLATTLAVHLRRNYSAARQNIAASAGLTPYKLRRVIEYIDANLDQSLSLGKVARVAGMSPYYFSRVMRKATGLAPHAHVALRRIERAKQLLSETKLPIIDIALRVGFSNHSHFSTQFRKTVGITPTAYRLM